MQILTQEVRVGPGLVVSHKLPGITAAPAGLQTPHGAAKPGGETRFSTPPSKPTCRSFRKGGMLEGVGGEASLRNPNHRDNLLYDARNPKLVLCDSLEGGVGGGGVGGGRAFRSRAHSTDRVGVNNPTSHRLSPGQPSVTLTRTALWAALLVEFGKNSRFSLFSLISWMQPLKNPPLISVSCLSGSPPM